MKWLILCGLVPFFYLPLRLAAWFWFIQRTKKAIRRRFPGSYDYRYHQFWRQHYCVDSFNFYPEFWKPCKAFIKDWGFMEVALTGPNGGQVTVEQLTRKYLPKYPGWKPLIVNLCEDLEASNLWDGWIQAIGVRLGILTFTIAPRQDQSLTNRVFAAIEQSSRTCEICGERGWLRSRDKQYNVRCSEHEEAK